MKNNIKNVIAVLCVSFILLTALITVKASDVNIEVASKTIAQGSGTESVQIPIEISGNTGIVGMTLKVSCTDGMILTGISEGSALSSLLLTTPGDLTANPVSFLWDGIVADATNGEIVMLTFDVPKTVEKTYFVNITLDSAFDNNLQSMNISVSSGSITVKGGKEPVTPVATITAFTVTNYGANSLVNVAAESVPDGAKLCVASYDSTGKLLEVYMPSLTSGTGSAIFSTSNVKTYKAYIWDNALNPVSLHKEYITN